MSFIQSVSRYAAAHKFISGIVIVLIVGGGYYAYTNATSTTGETRYVLGTVQRGTIVSSVTASGQVAASDQIDVKPKVSGTITNVYVVQGQTVHAGQVMARIDSRDAAQAVLSAEQSLAQAKLQYEKDSAQAPIDFQNASDTLATAQSDLDTTYVDTFNTLSNDFLALPSVMANLDSTIHGYDLSPTRSQWNIDVMKNLYATTDSGPTISTFADKALADYTLAQTKYTATLANYKTLTRYSSHDDLESMTADAIDTTTAAAQAIQSEVNFFDTVIKAGTVYNRPVSSTVTTLRTNAKNDLSTINTNLSALLAQQKAITNAKKAIVSAQQNIQLLQVGNTQGNNPISLQSEASSIVDKTNSLQTLRENLADYTIVAPFDGVVSVVNAKVGDSAGSAAIASVITHNQVANLSMNEVDAAKVVQGDKVTLTFDAVPDLTLTGKVALVDTVGTVSQGVVSYNIKISLDTQEPSVKPGMTANASIVTSVHTDVLYVPSSAVKTSNNQSTVQVFTPALVDTSASATSSGTQGVLSAIPPKSVPVTLGITDDTNVEIVSGLTEGQQIVTRTIVGSTATAAAASSASRTTTPAAGGSRGGSSIGGIRIP